MTTTQIVLLVLVSIVVVAIAIVVGLTLRRIALRRRFGPEYERVVDERDFISLTTRNPHGDRKTMAVRHCHELGRFAASSDSNKRTPLFAPAWEPSMNASVRSIFPR